MPHTPGYTCMLVPTALSARRALPPPSEISDSRTLTSPNLTDGTNECSLQACWIDSITWLWPEARGTGTTWVLGLWWQAPSDSRENLIQWEVRFWEILLWVQGGRPPAACHPRTPPWGRGLSIYRVGLFPCRLLQLSALCTGKKKHPWVESYQVDCSPGMLVLFPSAKRRGIFSKEWEIEGSLGKSPQKEILFRWLIILKTRKEPCGIHGRQEHSSHHVTPPSNGTFLNPGVRELKLPNLLGKHKTRRERHGGTMPC